MIYEMRYQVTADIPLTLMGLIHELFGDGVPGKPYTYTYIYILYYIMLYYIILYYVILYFIILYYITLNFLTLHYITLHYIIL